MKIDDKDVQSSSLQNIARTGPGNSSNRPASSGVAIGAPSDAVNLSGLNKVLSDGMGAGETARAGRIAELRQLYVSGQYHVDAQELSRSIVDAQPVRWLSLG